MAIGTAMGTGRGMGIRDIEGDGDGDGNGVRTGTGVRSGAATGTWMGSRTTVTAPGDPSPAGDSTPSWVRGAERTELSAGGHCGQWGRRGADPPQHPQPIPVGEHSTPPPPNPTTLSPGCALGGWQRWHSLCPRAVAVRAASSSSSGSCGTHSIVALIRTQRCAPHEANGRLLLGSGGRMPPSATNAMATPIP